MLPTSQLVSSSFLSRSSILCFIPAVSALFYNTMSLSFPVFSEEVGGYGVVDSSNFLTIEEPKIPAKKESPQKEKQILVDPISLREPSFSLMLPPPVVTSPRPLPPLLPPSKPNFLSCSLPNLAVSSPRLSSILSKNRWKNESQASPRQVDSLVRQQSQSRFSSLQDSIFRRSKSCGEGKACAPSDEFDLCLHEPNPNQNPNAMIEYNNNKISIPSFSKADSNKDIHKKMDSFDDQEFKCGALCLFLPGFTKAKTVRPRKEEATTMENVISRTVSLEKFECGSWASSAIVNEHDEDGESMNLYFDLPLELIRSSVNEAHSPINAAFVFDKDLKGVLKSSSSRTTAAAARNSHESSRHVRFSVSSPTSYPTSPASSSCITPRLRKARDDFNAFLEAQSA